MIEASAPAPPDPPHQPANPSAHGKHLAVMALGALGVVYADIGTSPLYAIQEFLPTLFLVQRRGTAGVGAVFGPITLVWFVSIAATGLPGIVANPGVLVALNPVNAVGFLLAHGFHGFLVLGSVVLCITGGEALYAD